MEKEKRGRSYAAHRHPQLSDEKKAKIKTFTKDFAHKILRNLKAKGKLRRTVSSSSARVDHSPNTPAMTPSRVGITPWDTPAMGESSAASAATSTPRGSINGDSLLTEMFGEDDVMDLDDGGAPSLAPDATPSTSTHDVGTPLGSPPPPSSPLANGSAASVPARKPVVVDHASGPFLARGPVLVDRFEGFKSSRRGS